MNKITIGFLLAFSPILALAADNSSLSFAPPPTDYSVVFLGNIFGIVDGVLHGTGSQIMGSIFAVFNAAVLALGGMVIMYTLLVSTMNTAHEGQMLGQKWSSIWIPIRSTIGLALLIPKASGYCLMQIFVMWIVVQGVGAADKVWNAALDYLNRGGVIVQAQMDPTKALLTASTTGVPNGAQIILAGQVCMTGLQKKLEAQRQQLLTQKASKAGPCYTPSTSGIISELMDFCNRSVPDFINSVNAVSIQSASPDSSEYFVKMPNFDDAFYSKLNGICGTINWKPYSTSTIAQINNPDPLGNPGAPKVISASDLDTAKMSRAIAIQQMYLDLSTVAQIMVNNDPAIVTQGNGTQTPYSSVAQQQFGVPLQADGSPCQGGSATPSNCVTWGPIAGSTSGALFSGTEFQGAINDYNGIMMPTLNLARQAKEAGSANSSRQFITQASSSGWIMAGSYFFNLVNLNQQALGGSGLTDSDTGINASSFDVTALNAGFSGGGSTAGCDDKNIAAGLLCRLFQKDSTAVVAIQQLITGPNASSGKPNLDSVLTPRNDINASTVYGYTNNAMILRLPGQPGQAPLQFANFMHISVDTSTYQLPGIDFGCGGTIWTGCIPGQIANLLYNGIIRTVFNLLLGMFQQIVNTILMTFLFIPLQGMAVIFQQGLALIQNPGVNPIVALANMGTYYINFAGNLWLMLIEISLPVSIIPVVGIFIFALLGLVLPILLAWLGIMVSIGFVTAYYVPVLPYMIFTFGAIAWLMAVIEAMVAAPIVALGVTHPEGHDAFGKGEQAIMFLMNVFLRPSMMIIGYIAAISLSYVGVWILNAGFDTAVAFVQGGSQYGTQGAGVGDIGNMWSNTGNQAVSLTNQPGAWTSTLNITPVSTSSGSIAGGYTGWAGVFAFFFSILVYTTMYLTIVQRSFDLIAMLPDKVLRWIGGQPESTGQEAAKWGDQEVKGKIGDAAKGTQEGQAAMDKQLTGYAEKGKAGIKKATSSGGHVDAKPTGGE